MRSAAALVLAVLLALFLAFGGSGAGTSDGAGAGGRDPSLPSVDTPEDDTAADPAASYSDRMRRRLQDRGLTVQRSSSQLRRDCAQHADGDVGEFLRRHRCVGVERAWFEVDDGGDAALVAAAWVGMPDADAAGRLRALLDRGTGGLTELSTEDGPHRDVRYRGRYHRSDRDGNTVGDVQVEPLQDTDGSRDVAGRAAGAVGID